jgi:hypothetical protein
MSYLPAESDTKPFCTASRLGRYETTSFPSMLTVTLPPAVSENR